MADIRHPTATTIAVVLLALDFIFALAFAAAAVNMPSTTSTYEQWDAQWNNGTRTQTVNYQSSSSYLAGVYVANHWRISTQTLQADGRWTTTYNDTSSCWLFLDMVGSCPVS